MHLINIRTPKLESFVGDDQTPPYFVLSHTWGSDEVTYQEFTQQSHIQLETRQGYRKIAKFCNILLESQEWMLARTMGVTATSVDYTWVDTCCINKDSSAELSEAINSMFRWYQRAVCCVVWLSDVLHRDLRFSFTSRPRWASRGWTLQELIAPKECYFYNKDWKYMGDRLRNVDALSRLTQIDASFLDSNDYREASIAEKMSWASNRETSRAEDRAYCLLGIFDINMPLIYGEGGEKAFIRLQEEILKESSDESIFAWDGTGNDGQNSVGMLATHPLYFMNGAGITSWPMENRHNPQGLRAGHIQMKATILRQERSSWAYLNCSTAERPDQKMAVPVIIQENTADGPVIRRGGAGIIDLPSWHDDMPENVLFLKRGLILHQHTFKTCRVRWDPRQLELLGAWPNQGWKPAYGFKRANDEKQWCHHEAPHETHIDLDLRLVRAIAHGAGIISHTGESRGVHPAALAFKCRSENELNSYEGFVIEMEVRPSGDVVRSIIGTPAHLLPPRNVAFQATPLWRHISKLLHTWPSRTVKECEKDPRELPHAAVGFIEQTALKHWRLDLWTKEGTAGRKTAIDTTIRVITEKDAIAQCGRSRRLMGSPSVEVIDRARNTFVFVTKKAAMIHETSDDGDQESLVGEYWE